MSTEQASGGYGRTTLAALRREVVGRSREAELVVAALMAGRHLLLLPSDHELPRPPYPDQVTGSIPATATGSPTALPLDQNCRLEPSPDLRTLDGGRVLLGGTPLRLLRLSPIGAAVTRGWFAGEPVGDRFAHHQLARRLEANGMAHLRWPSATTQRPSHQAAVIIPTRDHRGELDRTLAAEPWAWAAGVIVVDDGSVPPLEPSFAADSSTGRSAVRVVRRDHSGGPGVARQTGLDLAETEVAVLIDAGVVLDSPAAIELLDAFADPAVVAVAPRILAPFRADPAGRYDHRRSPLDLGPIESLVGPGRAVPYVPTACLAVRLDAVDRVGGFDPDLRFGEDVDLVWRLAHVGHVRYLPHLTATHPSRATVGQLIRQRRAYGSAATPLAERHGVEATTPCRISPWSLVVTGLALAGRPLPAGMTAAGLTAIGTGLALQRKLEPLPDARAEAMNLALRGHWHGSRAVVTASVRSWIPALALAGLVGGLPRRLALSMAAAGFARRLIDGPRRPADAAIDLGVGLVDDLAYCAGLWQGAVQRRSLAALRPVVADWPGSDRSSFSGLTRQALRLRQRLGEFRRLDPGGSDRIPTVGSNRATRL